MTDKLKYCNTCPKRASCNLYKENSFCEIDNNLLDEYYGFDRARQKELEKLFNAQKSDETNSNCKYFKKVREEIKEIILLFEEIKKENEESE